MVRRLIYVGVLLTLLVGGDVATRGFVEAKVSQRAQLEAPPGSRVTASVGGFPFVPPLLLGGQVSHVGVHIANLTADVVAFADVDVDLRGVHLDRGRLINDRKARIKSIDSGTVTATVTQEALGAALHVPIKMADGLITVTVLAVDVRVTPSVDAHGRLTLSGPLGRSFSLVIPTSNYLPCIGNVAVFSGKMTLSCQIHQVPPALLDAVNATQGG